MHSAMVELWPALAADGDATMAGEGETTFKPRRLGPIGGAHREDA